MDSKAAIANGLRNVEESLSTLQEAVNDLLEEDHAAAVGAHIRGARSNVGHALTALNR